MRLETCNYIQSQLKPLGNLGGRSGQQNMGRKG